MKKVFIVFVFCLEMLSLNAQDTLVFLNNKIEEVNIVMSTEREIEYRLNSYPDGPIFKIETLDLKEIKYFNGNKRIYNDQKYLFKTYNPSVYIVYGLIDGKYIGMEGFNKKVEVLNYLGISHDGVFKFFKENRNTLNVGWVYSLNILTGRTTISESNLYTILNTYGWQLEFGRRADFRFVFQGMAGHHIRSIMMVLGFQEDFHLC